MHTGKRLGQALLAPMFLALLIGCSGSSDSGTDTTSTTPTTPTPTDTSTPPTTTGETNAPLSPSIIAAVGNLGSITTLSPTISSAAVAGLVLSPEALAATQAAVLRSYSGDYQLRTPNGTLIGNMSIYSDGRFDSLFVEPGIRMRIAGSVSVEGVLNGGGNDASENYWEVANSTKVVVSNGVPSIPSGLVSQLRGGSGQQPFTANCIRNCGAND